MAGVLAHGPGRRECRFHNLYKKKGPSWREKFYRRCAERLKTSRETEVNRHRFPATSSPLLSSSELRSVVRKLMKEEWFLFIHDDVRVDFPEFDSTDFEENKLMEEMENELRSIEAEMIAQEFEKVSLEETSVINTFELKSILCPVCQIERLTCSNSSISCPCGAEIRNDTLSISDLNTQLMDILQLHNSSCEFDLGFNSQSGQLFIFCHSCNFNGTIM